jgi:hypothetical protein
MTSILPKNSDSKQPIKGQGGILSLEGAKKSQGKINVPVEVTTTTTFTPDTGGVPETNYNVSRKQAPNINTDTANLDQQQTTEYKQFGGIPGTNQKQQEQSQNQNKRQTAPRPISTSSPTVQSPTPAQGKIQVGAVDNLKLHEEIDILERQVMKGVSARSPSSFWDRGNQIQSAGKFLDSISLGRNQIEAMTQTWDRSKGHIPNNVYERLLQFAQAQIEAIKPKGTNQVISESSTTTQTTTKPEVSPQTKPTSSSPFRSNSRLIPPVLPPQGSIPQTPSNLANNNPISPSNPNPSTIPDSPVPFLNDTSQIATGNYNQFGDRQTPKPKPFSLYNPENDQLCLLRTNK